MVPFSFEKIARSADLDALTAFPISASARATHESFETHLRRATTSAVEPPARRSAHNDPHEQPRVATGESPRNEPVRRETSDTVREDADIREDDSTDTTTTSKSSNNTNDEEVDQESGSDGELAGATAVEEQRAAIHAFELESPGDSSEEAQGETDQASEELHALDGSLLTSAEAAAEDASDSEAGQADLTKDAAQRARESDLTSQPADTAETNEEVIAAATHRETADAETNEQDDEKSRISDNQQRHAKRNDGTASRLTNETAETATKPVDASLVEVAAETANEQNSRQRHHHNDADPTLPIATATTTDTETTATGTPSRFAQHLLTRTGDSNARGVNITDADQTRFVDRVARALQATGERGGTLRLRLSPPELGSLTLEVKIQGGAVSARVEADTSTARSLLLENLPMLRERLAEYGMRVDQFDVDLSDRHAGGTPDGLQQNDQQQGERSPPRKTAHDAEESAHSNSQEAIAPIGNEQLNIIV